MADSVKANTESAFHDAFLSELERQVRHDQFRAWFSDIRLLELTEAKAIFGVSSGFARDWLERNYLREITKSVQAANDGVGLEVGIRVLRVDGPDESRAVGVGAVAVSEQGANAVPPEEESEAARLDTLVETPLLSDDYRFDSFVVGNSNRLAHAAALTIANNPGVAYNPLFIHGETGVGKTHLLQAVCHLVLRERQDARVSYLSCEDFIGFYVQAIQHGFLDAYRRKIRTRDVLVIDDIQFLAKLERTQEEFFHAFNELYNSKRQIVISSDRAPHHIPMIEDRLVSRFKWGLVAEIDAPEPELRVALVHRKARRVGVEVPADVAAYVAEQCGNIREIEGAITKLIAVMRLTDRELSPQLASDVLRDMVAQTGRAVTASSVLELVSNEYSVASSDILGKRRSRVVSQPRAIAMYLTRQMTDLSLEEIGRSFGGRDHTTVLYAVEKVRKQIHDDRRFREMVESLAQKLGDG